jgi:signal peptidase II
MMSAFAAPDKGSGFLKLLIVVGLVLIADQATKLVIMHNLPRTDEIVVVPNFFSIVHYHNPGGAFGIFSNVENGFRHTFFIVVSILALGIVIYFYRTTPRTHRFLSTGFALILGGAVGNLADRFRLGEVVDFLDFYVGKWHWPAFNVADSAISIGIGIFVFHLLFGKLPDGITGKNIRSETGKTS